MVSLEIILKQVGDHHPITNSCQCGVCIVLPVNRTGPNSDLASFYGQLLPNANSLLYKGEGTSVAGQLNSYRTTKHGTQALNNAHRFAWGKGPSNGTK